MNRGNILKLIASITIGVFNWRRPATCLGGHSKMILNGNLLALDALQTLAGLNDVQAIRLYQARDVETGFRLMSDSEWSRTTEDNEDHRKLAVSTLVKLITPSRAKLTKMSKERRRKVFRELFVANKVNYQYHSVTNCLIGQLIRFATGTEHVFDLESEDRVAAVNKFYGLNYTERQLNDLWTGSGWVGEGNRDHADALATLDEVVFF